MLAGQGARGFKIGACDWSLDKRCDPAAFDVARQIGLDGVQVDLGSPRNQMRLRRPEVQAEFVKAAKRTGLEIAALAVVETNDVPLKSDPRAAGWLADAVDVCQALRVQVVMPACFGAGNLDMSKTAEIDQLVRVLKSVAAKAEKRGVVIGVESYLSAEENRRLLDRVGSPAVKVYYDVGNSTDKGRDVCKEIRAGRRDMPVPLQGRRLYARTRPDRLPTGPQGNRRNPLSRLDPDRGRDAARIDRRLHGRPKVPQRVVSPIGVRVKKAMGGVNMEIGILGKCEVNSRKSRGA